MVVRRGAARTAVVTTSGSTSHRLGPGGPHSRRRQAVASRPSAAVTVGFQGSVCTAVALATAWMRRGKHGAEASTCENETRAATAAAMLLPGETHTAVEFSGDFRVPIELLEKVGRRELAKNSVSGGARKKNRSGGGNGAEPRMAFNDTNNKKNYFALQPAPTPVETNNGGRNMVNKVHEFLLALVLVVSVLTQKNAPSDQLSQNCFNCLEPGHHLSECPLPRPTRVVCRCFNCGKTGHLSEGCPMPKCHHRQVNNIVATSLPSQVISIPKCYQPSLGGKVSITLNHHSEHRRSLYCFTSNYLKVTKSASTGQAIPENQLSTLTRDNAILQQRPQSMSQVSGFKIAVNISHAPHAVPTLMPSK
uniref:CCHC-type domain-containing protein n=1 Tax=Oryza punctata TaxID=4537 RepID=A0A0E0KEF1_ORYPU